MEKYEFVVALPTECYGLKSRIMVALQKEWAMSEITFEDTDVDQCLVTSVTIPKSASITDTASGEEVGTTGTIAAAQEMVSRICNGDSSS